MNPDLDPEDPLLYELPDEPIACDKSDQLTRSTMNDPRKTGHIIHALDLPFVRECWEIRQKYLESLQKRS